MIYVQLPAELHNAMMQTIAKRPAEEVFDLLTAVVREKVVVDTEAKTGPRNSDGTPFLE